MNPSAILTATFAISVSLMIIRKSGSSVWICWCAAIVVGLPASTDYLRALFILGCCGALLEYFTTRHVETK